MGGLEFEVLGNSGKMTFYKKAEGKSTGVVVEMDSLTELGADFAAVGKTGSVGRSFLCVVEIGGVDLCKCFLVCL